MTKPSPMSVSADRPAENVGVVAHGSLVPEENSASRLAIAAANCIAWLADNPDTDESYRKSARQVEAELRTFASKQPPAPTLSEVIAYRKEMERIVELKKLSPAADRPVEPPDYVAEKRCEIGGGWFGPDCERCDGKRYTQSSVLTPCPECNPAAPAVENSELREALEDYRRAVVENDRHFGDGNTSELLSVEVGAKAIEELFARQSEALTLFREEQARDRLTPEEVRHINDIAYNLDNVDECSVCAAIAAKFWRISEGRVAND